MKTETPRAKADELRKTKHFEEAAREYALLWPDGDRWTGWGYAFCLRKSGQNAEAVRVARELYALVPEFQLGRALYAWTLYDAIRAEKEPKADAVLAHAKTIVSLTASEENKYATLSPFVPTLLRIAKAWVVAGRHNRALEWLDKLDPDQLQTAEFLYSDHRGRERKLASHRERYYSLRTHSLERLERWQECLDTATRAMTDCAPLHHDNDVWFARRIARAKVKLGRAGEGIMELEQLAARKSTSFIHTDIAAAAWEMGDVERTIEHALRAVESPGEIGFKLTAVLLLAQVQWAQGKPEEARTHLRLCIAVRNARAWKIDNALNGFAIAWGVDSGDSDADGLLHELQRVWRTWRDERTPRQTGTIQRMLPNGRAGFIRGSDNDFYFDTRDWKERKSKPAEGIRVTFATKAGFDRKRQQATSVACEVRVAAHPSEPAS